MVTIEIESEAENHEQLAEMLLVIAASIKEGHNAGYDPEWYIKGVEEKQKL
jgi:hypothetical protein